MYVYIYIDIDITWNMDLLMFRELILGVAGRLCPTGSIYETSSI